MVPVVLVYYAVLLGLGAQVWWYFFLLLENRTVPPGVVLLLLLFLSTAGVLAHALHERGLAPGALSWPAVDRRGPDRMTDEEWAALLTVEPRLPRRRRPAAGTSSRRRPPGTGGDSDGGDDRAHAPADTPGGRARGAETARGGRAPCGARPPLHRRCSARARQ